MVKQPQQPAKLPKARTVRQAGESGDRRSVSRISSTAPTRHATGILTGLTAAEAAAGGMRVVDVGPETLIPHPFNDPSRSTVVAGDPAWDELVESVGANGVRIATAAVTRAAFADRWPSLLPEDLPGRYVLIYGHRRRAAALATQTETMPVIIDNSVLDAPDGGLVAMVQENRGRDDLSPLAEGELLAKFVDELGMNQRKLAETLGMTQATVSRRLSLLLLAPSLRAAVADGTLNPTEAATLGARLPYGPVRRWQKDPQPEEQASEFRIEEQERAHSLVRSGVLASQAAERVIAEAESRVVARQKGIKIVDLASHFGDLAAARRYRIYDDVTEATGVVAVIDDLGALTYYRNPTPGSDAGRSEAPTSDTGDGSVHSSGSRGDGSALTKAAEKARRSAARQIVHNPPPQTRLMQVLADQYALGICAHVGPRAEKLAIQWGYEPGSLSGPQDRVARAWALALAAYELVTGRSDEWGMAQKLYLDLLRERAKYEPTPWEVAQLDGVPTS